MRVSDSFKIIPASRGSVRVRVRTPTSWVS